MFQTGRIGSVFQRERTFDQKPTQVANWIFHEELSFVRSLKGLYNGSKWGSREVFWCSFGGWVGLESVMQFEHVDSCVPVAPSELLLSEVEHIAGIEF